MKLVDDWRDVLKWHSTWAMAILAALPLVWIQIPEDVKSFLPEAWEPWVLTAIALSGLVGRVRAQGGDK